MASSIQHNEEKRVVLHATSNTTWVIAGNSSVSNVATGDETVISGSIKQVWFGSPSGNNAYWTIKRGANTVAVLSKSKWIPYSALGKTVTLDSSANVTVELTNAGDNLGFIMIELSKNLKTDQPPFINSAPSIA